MTSDETERVVLARITGKQTFAEIAVNLGYPEATVIQTWQTALRVAVRKSRAQSKATLRQAQVSLVDTVPQAEEERSSSNWVIDTRLPLSPGLHIHGIAPNLWRKGPGIRLAIPRAWRKRIIRLCGETCQYCGRSGGSTYGPDWYVWHIDHIVSVAEGGNTTLDNLTLACQHCNLLKGAKHWKSGPFAR